MRKELVNQLMRSSGSRKNRRSGRAFALSGNVKFPPLAIKELSFMASASALFQLSVPRQTVREMFAKWRSFYWGLPSVGDDAGNNFFSPVCVAPQTGRQFV